MWFQFDQLVFHCKGCRNKMMKARKSNSIEIIFCLKDICLHPEVRDMDKKFEKK